MKRVIQKSIIVLIVCSSILSACGRGSAGSATERPDEEQPELSVTADPATLFAGEPNPASMEVTLEEGTSATSTIGPGGGSLVATDKNGTKYTLTIPEGALISPIEISMTPIANAGGKPIGDTFLAGVDLQPDGLTFLKLVNLEISGDVIEEGAVGFASTSDGQDLHLTPYDSTSGSLAVSIGHFSDPGAAQDDAVELLKQFLPEDERAKLDQFLADATGELAFRALEGYLVDLLPKMEVDDYLGWEIVTERINHAILRIMEESIDGTEWSEGEIERLAKLVGDNMRQWADSSEAVSRTLVEECQQGHIAYLKGIFQIKKLADAYLNHPMQILPRDALQELSDQLKQDIKECTQFDIQYTATVTGEGTYQGENLYSDISLYTEAEIRDFEKPTPWKSDLNVDYMTGVWEICEPRPGTAQLDFDLEVGTPNLGLPLTDDVDSFKAYVSITDPVYIDCAPVGYQIDADAQAPFHGGALDELNKDRSTDQGWEFELEYDPEGSIIAQFPELWVVLNVPGSLTYEVTQIVDVLLPGTSE